MFRMDKSSMNTTAWFLLRSFDDLCTKSFLMLAILLCNFETLNLGFFQFFENFFLRLRTRCNFATFTANCRSGDNCSSYSPFDRV